MFTLKKHAVVSEVGLYFFCERCIQLAFNPHKTMNYKMMNLIFRWISWWIYSRMYDWYIVEGTLKWPHETMNWRKPDRINPMKLWVTSHETMNWRKPDGINPMKLWVTPHETMNWRKPDGINPMKLWVTPHGTMNWNKPDRIKPHETMSNYPTELWVEPHETMSNGP